MVVALSVLAAAAILVAVYFGIKTALLKRALKKIGDRLDYILDSDTNIGIDATYDDKQIRLLTRRLNRGLSDLRRIKRECAKESRELKEAAANISHDLRTPLTSVTGYVAMLKKCELSEDGKRYLAVIEGRVEAMKRLTEELFTYSVTAADSPPGAAEPVCLNDMLEDTLTQFYTELTRKNIEPVIDLCGERVLRTLDRSALARVLENVLSNAVKYSLGDLSVTLSPDGVMRFSNRADLDKVTVGRLFDRFFTVESARSSTGLGLTIARILTERMEGRISADYAEGVLTITVAF